MLRPLRVRVTGSGIASVVLTRLLLAQGVQVFLDPPAAAKAPQRWVAAPIASLRLLAEVFGESDPADFSDAVFVGWRIVDWSERPPSAVRSEALIVDIEEIARRLRARLRLTDAESPTEVDWTIVAGGRRGADFVGGTRTGVFIPVVSPSHWPRDVTLLRAADLGWVYVIPVESGSAVALAVAIPGRPHDEVVASAGLIACGAPGPEVRVAPGLAHDPSGRLLVAGDAQFAVDPLRGDGVGNAVRGALLASASVLAVADGVSAAKVSAHRRARAASAFVAHLDAAVEHYESARNASRWAGEIAAMRTARGAATGAAHQPTDLRLERGRLVSWYPHPHLTPQTFQGGPS